MSVMGHSKLAARWWVKTGQQSQANMCLILLAHLYHRRKYGHYILSEESYKQTPRFVIDSTLMAQIHNVMISTTR